MEKINVIDSIMGSGKTTWAINEIKSHPENNYIYITPYLDELKRMKESVKPEILMYEPIFTGEGNKKDNFHKLLSDGKNICSTHALFTKADNTTRELLHANNYILILDEVMNVVSEMPDFNKDDLDTLLNEELAYMEGDYLLWNMDKQEYNGRYKDIMTMCINRNIIVLHDKLVYWNFPVDIFNYFYDVYILTFLFKAQIQRYYYDFHGIDYNYYQIENFKLVPFDLERRHQRIGNIKPLINIYDGKINAIGDKDTALSKTWFERDLKNKGSLSAILQKNLSNYFNNIYRSVPNSHRLWCTFKDSQSALKGKGYTKRFLSMNTRATNAYIDTEALAYCCNRFLKPDIKTLFNNRGIEVSENLWATSELIQWIWRSQIRRGQPISIYIPSKRMRQNLQLFLENEKLD